VPPTLGDRLIHIFEAIDEIQIIFQSKTVETISRDRILRLALERSFEREEQKR
jgi:hypothetical protein